MRDPYILCIETAIGTCSVAIGKGDQPIALVTEPERNKASERLHTMIEEVCEAARIPLKSISAVAVSGGPGSYTGLRIGSAAAKGICYGLNIPLIHIDTLKAMQVAAKASIDREYLYYIPMIDARRMDAFICVLNQSGEYIVPPHPATLTATTFRTWEESNNSLFFGDALGKYKIMFSDYSSDCLENFTLSADSMVSLAFKAFINNEIEDVAYYEPKYYKEFHSSRK